MEGLGFGCAAFGDPETTLLRIGEGMDTQLGLEIDSLLVDDLEEGLLGTPMEQQMLHLMRRVDGSLLLGCHEARTDTQDSIRTIFDVYAGGRGSQDDSRIVSGM